LDFLKDWTTVTAVVFIAAMSAFNILFLAYLNQSSDHEQIAGSLSFEENIYSSAASFYGISPLDAELGVSVRETKFIVIDSASVLGANNPISNVMPTREGLLIYKVQKGDNLSRIAANFGISLNTILWANNNLKPNLLQPGQEIIILPVAGVLHQIREGESLESIAAKYGITIQRILNANLQLIPAKLSEGTTIIIPDAQPLRSSQLASLYSLPDLPGYFSIPTTGWNWGKLHNYNAVDIANICSTPVYAAAEGLVIEEVSSGWNGGYGKYVFIEHPNSTKTKYAHTGKNIVSVGDYVVKGDLIAYIGNTGTTHGPTGCHLHFEVYGARNPFAK
jgi:murein DD-endopeptidase MepM/ murein hydrolase activator NlpD